MRTPKAKPEARTVKQLIALLRQQDPEALVATEGCDCVGDWSGTLDAYVSHGIPTVCINRDDRPDE